MSQKKNFIMTTYKDTADKLIAEGLQLVSNNNGVYTFLNQPQKNLSFDEIDKTTVAYTNMLNI